MKTAVNQNQTLTRQIWHFIIHLRWHYQLFILSGGFLMGGYLSSGIDWPSFALQFANVHLLLFGGATAYNSYCDKDEGPVGGLKHPPPMQSWMWGASLLVQLTGVLIALAAGYLFSIIYVASIILFWLYSSPQFRWKGTPVRSLIAIGVSTGTNSLLLGYLAAGNNVITAEVWIASLGVALIILSLYPTSQLYQMNEDQERGDRTFAIVFGYSGVIRFFQLAYSGGIILLGLAIGQDDFWTGLAFILAGSAVGILVYLKLMKLGARKDDYSSVMRIKYGTSFAFVAFIIVLLFLKHRV